MIKCLKMYILGLTSDEIKGIIDNNTFSGLTAKLKFMHWKRC